MHPPLRQTSHRDRGDGGGEFDEVAGEALSLAIQVTGISPSIDQTARINDTLNTLEAQIKNGNVDKSTAIKAVERIKLGQDITESSLAGLGPSVVPSPENPETFIGAPAGSPAADGGFNIAGTTVQNTLLLVISILILMAGYARLAGYLGPLGSGIQKSISAASDFVTAAIGAVPFIQDALKNKAQNIKRDAVDKIKSDDISDKNAIYDIIIDPILEAKEYLANQLLRAFEQFGGNHPFDDELAEFDTALGADDGTLKLQGTQNGAEAAAANGIDRVNEELRYTKNALKILGIGSLIGGLIAAAGTALTFTGIGAAVGTLIGAFGAILGVSFSFLSSVAGTDGFYEVQAAHADALSNIVSGTSGV